MRMCDKCNSNPATVMIKQIIDGQVTERCLCSACAQEEGFTTSLFSMSDVGKMLAGLMSQGMGNAPSRRIRRGQYVCPSCGFDLTDFGSSARLGCPNCYDAFREQLDSVIRRVQAGNVKHHGAIPDTSVQKAEPRSEIEILRAQLQQAIDSENYEKAAELRDQIRDLEKGDHHESVE